ncbi:MAG TPA: hypothetical protein VFD19_02740 [Clostridia bacterium]|nr:hypothetical protein [Clostridia bacterium]
MKSDRQPTKEWKPWKRAAVLFFALALAILATACAPIPESDSNLENGDRDDLVIQPQNDKYLREDEWVRMLTLAIGHPDKRRSVWDSIPVSQKNEITQADFFRYTSFLGNCLPGTITSFSPATMEESEAIRKLAAKSEKQLVPKPAQTAIWWIKARTSDLRNLRFAIPVTLNDNGLPYFSMTWLQKQADLNDYIVLYLNALELRSQSALKSLLSQGVQVRSLAQQMAIDRRVGALQVYYNDYIQLGKSGFRITDMMPGHAVIEELLLSTDPGSTKTRRVVFTETDGVFRAEEKITQDLAISDGVIFFNHEALFSSNSKNSAITSGTLLPKLGIPLDLTVIGQTEQDDTVFRLVWPGLVIEAVGNCDLDRIVFEGYLRQVSVSYSQFITGSGLKPGHSIYELYARYPFARESEYLISRQDDGLKKTLAIQVESDTIVQMTIILDS